MIRDPLSVLIVDSTNTFGGAFEIALTLSNSINQNDLIKLSFVSSQPPEVLESRVPEGISWYHLPRASWERPREGRLRKWIDVSSGLVRSEVPPALRLTALCRRLRGSLIQLNNSLNSQLFGALASRMAGARCVCSHRDYGYPSRIVRGIERLVHRHIACSKPIKDHLLRLGVPEEKISLVYDPVDTEIFSPEVEPADLQALFGIPYGRKVFAIFGRLVPWKGHEVFFKAARIVLEALPDAHAMIVGDVSGGEEAYGVRLRELARDLGISSRTTFTGYRADIPQLMRASDVLVHASLVPEPFGMVVLEGMACGRPIVAMDEGGPAELIERDVHGILVRPNDPGAIARAVTTLLVQADVASALGREARATCVERFSAPTIAKHYFDLYGEISGMGRHPAARPGPAPSGCVPAPPRL
jgi:glycosyltransferase involved in cell wall biosynthesis